MGGSYGEWVPSRTTRFVWDGMNIAAELTVDESAGTTNVTRYVWGLDLSGSVQGAGGVGGLIAVIRDDGSVYFPCYDANGNISEYVDVSGAVVAHREFDPFGNTTVETGSLVHELHFWFSTKYLDEETGNYVYQQRQYVPPFGRWASKDPIGDMVGALNRVSRDMNRLHQADFEVTPDIRDVQRLITVPSVPQITVLSGGQDLEFYSPSQRVLIQLQTMQANLLNPYGFAKNNSIMWIDPDGEWVVPVIVAAGAAITLAVVLPDWDADGLTAHQSAYVVRLIQALKKCATESKNSNVASYLDKMTITGVFKRGEPDGAEDASETRNGRFFGYGNRTILSRDFFIKDDISSQLQILLHEAYHASTEDWTENKSYNYAEQSFGDMECCLKKAGIIH